MTDPSEEFDFESTRVLPYRLYMKMRGNRKFRLMAVVLLFVLSMNSAWAGGKDFASCIRALASEVQSENAFLSQNDPSFGEMGKLLCGFTCTVNLMTLMRRHLGKSSPFPNPQTEMQHVLKVAEALYQKNNTYFSPQSAGISEVMLAQLVDQLLKDAQIPAKVTLESLEDDEFSVKEISAEKLLGGKSGNEIAILNIKKLSIESDSLLGVSVSTDGHAILSAGYHRDTKTVFLIDPWNPLGNPLGNSPPGTLAGNSTSLNPVLVSARLRTIQIPHLTGPTQLLELNEPLPIGFNPVPEGEFVGKSFPIVVSLVRIEFLDGKKVRE